MHMCPRMANEMDNGYKLMMKELGWYFFFALLLADVLAIAMIKLMVSIRVATIIAGIVFVLLAIIFVVGHNGRKRLKQREAQAVAKIAELQDQMEESYKKSNGTAI